MRSTGNFSVNLAKLREERGLTLREFSKKIGVSFQIISKIEKAESSPTLTTAIKICDALSISLDKMVR